MDQKRLDLQINPRLQPHQQRVVEERDELETRRTKLAAFINGAVFATVSPDERGRLEKQFHFMTQLSAVLADRINAF